MHIWHKFNEGREAKSKLKCQSNEGIKEVSKTFAPHLILHQHIWKAQNSIKLIVTDFSVHMAQNFLYIVTLLREKYMPHSALSHVYNTLTHIYSIITGPIVHSEDLFIHQNCYGEYTCFYGKATCSY